MEKTVGGFVRQLESFKCIKLNFVNFKLLLIIRNLRKIDILYGIVGGIHIYFLKHTLHNGNFVLYKRLIFFHLFQQFAQQAISILFDKDRHVGYHSSK